MDAPVAILYDTAHVRVDGLEFDAPMFTLVDQQARDISFADEVKYVLCLPPHNNESGQIGFRFYDSKKNPICAFEFPPDTDKENQDLADEMLLRTTTVPYFINFCGMGIRAQFLCQADSSVYEASHGTLH